MFSVMLCVFPVFCSLIAPTAAVTGYGYEMLMAKLDFLQYKLQEMELDWRVALDSLQSNLTALEAHSRQIEVQQSTCANREEVQKLISNITPKQAICKNDQHFAGRRFSEALRNKGPFQSCKEAPTNETGIYLIRVGYRDTPFEAFCEQTSFGGAWLVFQYRFDGSLDFYRNWTEYRNGFGNVYHEFWLGLERLHQLTSQRKCELMVELISFDGEYKYAHYNEFGIGSEAENYTLKNLGDYNGTAGESLSSSKGMKFTTADRDNDAWPSNCAVRYQGPWWHKSCKFTHLNGRYLNKVDVTSMYWFNFNMNRTGLAYSRMMIREV